MQYMPVNSSKRLFIFPCEAIRLLVKRVQDCCVSFKKEKRFSANKFLIEKYNPFIESIFKDFFNTYFLKHLLKTLNLYPDKQVISCDIAALVHNIFEESSSGQKYIHEELTLICDRKEFIENIVYSPCFLDFIRRHGFALHFLNT